MRSTQKAAIRAARKPSTTIYLADGQPVHVSKQDADLAAWLWCRRKTGKSDRAKKSHYATAFRSLGLHNADGRGHNRTQQILLHRIIAFRMGIGDAPFIDHKNGNTFDCRRSNLRGCTRAENTVNSKRYITNTHGFRGLRRHGTRWGAQVGNTVLPFSFKTKEEAARAYDMEAKKRYGTFAKLNFPYGGRA